MIIFNLAEELEKERKKNKELEEKLEKEKQYKKFYENLYLTSEDTNKQFRKMSKNLIDRIDKAIDFLESMDYCGQEDYFCDKTTVDEDPDGNNNSYYDSAERLYKILKGDNK